jgi:chromate transporter
MMSTVNVPSTSARESVDAPTKRGLFLGFLAVGLQGFGGVLPFARRMLVDQRRWLSAREFTEVLSLSQFLPGPNIVNVSIIVGNRFRGPLGSVAATLGLMLMPFVIVLALAALYARFADLAAVRGATNGVSAAATGLVIGTGFKMARALKDVPWHVVICALTFVAIALLRLPLLWVLAVFAPISVAIAWWLMRR